MEFIIDCSPEQIEIIGDHLLEGKELGILPDERQWMIAKVKQKHPNKKIKSADLDISRGTWILEIE